MKLPQLIASALMLSLALQTVSADVVETKTGARILGKVTQIDGTTVVVDTDYAGAVKIKQGDVTGITTEALANIRLSSGTVLQGTLASVGSGAVIITSTDGSIQSSVDKIVTTWAAGAKDPEIIALERNWLYEAGADIVGKSGNSDQLGTGFTFRATLKSIQDMLQFYGAYDRQVTEGKKSADQLKAGGDFQNSYSGRKSWYLRDEAGFDRVKLISFSNVAAAGLGYDFIKEPKHTLTGRAGIAHRFEAYQVDPLLYPGFFATTNDIEASRRLATKESVNTAGLDLGLVHAYETGSFKLVNRLGVVPSFKDFADFHGVHESYIELPLLSISWKIRMGLLNDYTSRPSPGKKKLDTTYYTRLVLNWK